ncbi:DUF5794 domain-containing protein [Halovenus marina]|uniref:DUF5794 domain-containing protein n=1 Tax=Halovenus marina TaxID=3396621 RepID=UPI003F564E2A
MSSSQHPVALTIEEWVGSSAALLAVVMLLPLIDGVFAALVLADALDSIAGIVEVGLLVFGGSAMVAVILAELDHPPRQQAKIVLTIGVVLVLGAAVQAALAPTIASVLDMVVFERFAALVILSIAASTASARIGEYIPGPGIIVVFGLIASLSPSGLSVSVQTDPELIARAAAAGLIGVGFALTVALASPWLRNAVDIDRFRFGSAVALGVLALSVLGLFPENAPVALGALAVTTLLSFDPGQIRERHRHYHPDDIDITTALSGPDDSAHGDEPLEEAPPAETDGSGTDTKDRPPWF